MTARHNESYTDETGRVWALREGARGGSTGRSAGHGVPTNLVALWFESGDERRAVLAPSDWRDRRDDLLPHLFDQATAWPND